MQTLENETAVNGVRCVQFREKADTDDDYYITIRSENGCYSYVSHSSKFFYFCFYPYICLNFQRSDDKIIF